MGMVPDHQPGPLIDQEAGKSLDAPVWPGSVLLPAVHDADNEGAAGLPKLLKAFDQHIRAAGVVGDVGAREAYLDAVFFVDPGFDALIGHREPMLPGLFQRLHGAAVALYAVIEGMVVTQEAQLDT